VKVESVVGTLPSHRIWKLVVCFGFGLAVSAPAHAAEIITAEDIEVIRTGQMAVGGL
jgi:hypothetical protein